MDIKRAFNFSSVNHKPLEFEQFYKAVMRVGVEVNNSKINELKKKLKNMTTTVDKKPKKKQTTKEKTEAEGEGEGESEAEGEGSER